MDINQIAEKSKQDAEFKKVVSDFDKNLRGILGSTDKVNTNVSKLLNEFGYYEIENKSGLNDLRLKLGDIRAFLGLIVLFQIAICLILIYKG